VIRPASTTIPLFGSLTTTHTTAGLQEPLPELVWMYEVDAKRRTVTYRAKESGFVVDLPLAPMHGTVGVAPAAFEARSSLVPDAHGGNMDTPEMRAGTHVLPGRQRGGGTLLDRGRTLPARRGRELRGRRRGGDGYGPDR